MKRDHEERGANTPKLEPVEIYRDSTRITKLRGHINAGGKVSLQTMAPLPPTFSPMTSISKYRVRIEPERHDPPFKPGSVP
jgi:hypothetical protein